jgi:hypothetical protein
LDSNLIEREFEKLNRSKQSFAYAKEITKPFGAIEQVLDWSKKELEEDWRWQLIEMSSQGRPGRYIFYFDSERDYLAFIMKWL